MYRERGIHIYIYIYTHIYVHAYICVYVIYIYIIKKDGIIPAKYYLRGMTGQSIRPGMLGEKGTPWHFSEDKSKLTGVSEKSLSKNMRFAVTPLVLTPFRPFPRSALPSGWSSGQLSCAYTYNIIIYIYIYIYTYIYIYIYLGRERDIDI